MGYDWCLINEVVLMQSTGLKDKNSKEIFEGDICKFDRITDKSWIVVYEIICGAFMLAQSKESKGVYHLHGEDEKDFSLKVIGNIHENPKLLKEIN